MFQNLLSLLLLLLPATGYVQILTYGEEKSRYDYAVELYNASKFAQAAEYCTDIITRGRSSEVYKLRAMAYRAMGLYERSAADYSEALQMRKEPQLYFDRAMVYVCNKAFENAELDINEAIRLFREQRPAYLKDNFYVLEEKGRISHYLGYYRDAINDFRSALGNGSSMAAIDLLSALSRNNNWPEVKQISENLLHAQRADGGGLLSDSTLLWYVTALYELATNGTSENTLLLIDRALNQYRSADNRCFQGFFYDLQAAKAATQLKLGYDSTAYESYKKLLAVNNRQPDVKRRVDELKLKLGIDAVPPLIALKNPQVDASNAVTVSLGKGSLELYGQVTDSSGIASLHINQQPVAKIEEDGLFVTNLLLQAGRNDVLITAIDKNDNKVEKMFVINALAQAAPAEDSTTIPELFSQATYHAVLIAEKDYQDAAFADLENPVKDAQELKDILIKQYQFEEKNISLLTNPNRLSLLDSLRLKAETLTEEDNLLIFYAGHGQVRRVGSNIAGGFIVPSDAKKGSWNTYVSSDDLKSSIQYSPAKHILWLVDACFGGALFRSIDDAPQNIQSVYAYKSRRFLTSGNLEEVPDKGKFILNLKEFLKNNQKKYVSANELYNFIMTNSESTLPRYDRIMGVDDNGGQFVFIRR